jgi:hypothetical protein
MLLSPIAHTHTAQQDEPSTRKIVHDIQYEGKQSQGYTRERVAESARHGARGSWNDREDKKLTQRILMAAQSKQSRPVAQRHNKHGITLP